MQTKDAIVRAPAWIASVVPIAAFMAVSFGGAAASAVPAPGATTAALEISEIFVGTAASPGAQYIVLRQRATTSAGFTGAAGYTLQAFDGTGTGTPYNGVALDHNVFLPQRGAAILIATPEAMAFFQVMADAVWLGARLGNRGTLCVVRPDGGRDDCLVYGDDVADPNVRLDPNVQNAAFNPWGGVPPGGVLQRYRTTGVSARDFWLRHVPWPQNSVGGVGAAPKTVCGDGALGGLEACDAGAACGAAGGACGHLCQLNPGATAAVCGNGTVEPGESCDDENTRDGDGCSSVCQVEPLGLVPLPVCGNGRLEAGEQCDAGSHNGGTDVPCASDCTSIFGGTTAALACGNGVVESPVTAPSMPTVAEQCDLGVANGTPGSACSSLCRWQPAVHPVARCGNGVVEPGEECDDGNDAGGDGCSSECLLEVAEAFVCGDGILAPGENCDQGSKNGTPGARCSSFCRWVAPPAAVAAAAVVPPAAAVSTTLAPSAPDNATVRAGGCSSVGSSGAWQCLVPAVAWRLRRRPRRLCGHRSER
jgi:cysteine-rich repeat protein